MSDQTPDIHDELGGGEPSMEDILASIRKIIADDDVTTALGSPESGMPGLQTALSTESVVEIGENSLDNVELASSTDRVDMEEPLVLAEDAILSDVSDDSVENIVEADDFELDLIVDETPGFVDLEIPDIPSDAPSEALDLSLEAAAAPILSKVSGNPAAEDDVLADLNQLLAEVETETQTLTQGSALDRVDIVEEMSAEAPSAALESGDLVRHDVPTEQSMMDEIEELLATVDDDAPEENLLQEVAYAEEFEAIESNLDASEITAAEEDEDLNLVKSLIADLTDSEEAEDLGAFETLADDASDSDDEADILDQILDMSLEDELAEADLDADLQALETADDIAMMEAENTRLNDEGLKAEAPSLSDIADAAEADAKGTKVAAVGALAALTAGAATIAGYDDAEEERQFEEEKGDAEVSLDDEAGPADVDFVDRILEVVETDDTKPAQHETAQEETPEMARTAAKKDSIIEGATAAATADAFASLNKVVEEKAVKAERGDRIGDLVMAALQPMLKEWLDANLKGIVERAVTKEVKRISTGK